MSNPFIPQHILEREPLSRRRFLSRSAMAATSLLGAGALLDACASSSPSTGSTGTTTLQVMFNELTQDQITEFQKLNPDIKIEILKVDPARLRAMLAAGTPPDLVRSAGAEDTPSLAIRNLATPLDTYFAKSSVFKPEMNDLAPIADAARFDNTTRTQGMGPRFSLAENYSQDMAFWYNKKVFDAARIPYPDPTTPITYDELLDLGKRLTQRDGDKIKVYGLCTNWDGQGDGILMQGVLQQGASIFNSDFTKVDVTTPEARKVLQFLVDWGKARIGNGPLDPAADWQGNLFLADRVGIIMYGYWYGGYAFTQNKAILDHIGFAPAPQFGSKRISATIGGTSMYIPTTSQNKDAAFKLFEYYLGPQQATARAKTGSGIPVFKSLNSDLPQDLPYQKQAYQTLQSDLNYFQLMKFSPYIGTSLINYIINDLTPVIQGSLSFDDGVAKLQNDLTVATSTAQGLIG
jgi:multiple sugar transport system substrate-binding protein